jgi:uncharacterized protein (TIGR02145 family)
MTDIDGNIYKTKEIGNSVWTVEDLKVTRFRNGDTITKVTCRSEWMEALSHKTPAYIESTRLVGRTSRIYNYYAVEDIRGLAPESWQIPRSRNWADLIESLGGSKVAGKKMKTSYGWRNKTTFLYFFKESGSGSNESGFSALPLGSTNSAGKVLGLGERIIWWSIRHIDLNSIEAGPFFSIDFKYDEIFEWDGETVEFGAHVRCVKIQPKPTKLLPIESFTDLYF